MVRYCAVLCGEVKLGLVGFGINSPVLCGILLWGIVWQGFVRFCLDLIVWCGKLRLGYVL